MKIEKNIMYRYRTGTLGRTECRYGMVPVPYHIGLALARGPVPVQRTLAPTIISKKGCENYLGQTLDKDLPRSELGIFSMWKRCATSGLLPNLPDWMDI